MTIKRPPGISSKYPEATRKEEELLRSRELQATIPNSLGNNINNLQTKAPFYLGAWLQGVSHLALDKLKSPYAIHHTP